MKLPPALVVLSPGNLTPEDLRGPSGDRRAAARLCAVAKALASGGGLLLREPDLDDRSLFSLGCELAARLGPNGWLGIHDRIHLAGACDADAVHLGFRSLAPKAARSCVGEKIAIGFSSHADEEQCASLGADYRFVSPVKAVPSKGKPLGLDGLGREGARHSVPYWALGGLGAQDANAVAGAGAHGLAVRGAVFGSDKPLQAVDELLRACAVFPNSTGGN